MTTYYLDFEGGNDSNDGTTFANRWKTAQTGATAGRTAPGDVIRVMGSPDATSLGQSATWTYQSKTVTLTTAVTATICDCESAWTASANVTSTADTALFKENTKSAKHVIATAFTTGLVAYFATGTLNLSGYQQVSFWLYNSAVLAASTLSLRLCTDTAGVTSVHTIAIPAIANSLQWYPVTVDLGSNLNAAIASVALYADLDPGSTTIQLDNIIACKASASADSLSLTSLIGKVWNLSWVASTTYAANDIRKPTQPNRNGFRYKVTAGGGGSAGSSEPTWPTMLGTTVSDGALTWTCDAYEDTWYAIQSISGTTVKLDNAVSTLGSAGRGYSGTTETVATYKRQPILGLTTGMQVARAGSFGSPITFSGGWDRTAMSAQTLETWVSQTGLSGSWMSIAFNYIDIRNISTLRAVTAGFSISGAAHHVGLYSCHSNNNSTHGVQTSGVVGWLNGSGIACHNNSTDGIRTGGTVSNEIDATRLSCSGNIGSGFSYTTVGQSPRQRGPRGGSFLNNGSNGAFVTNGATLTDVVTAGNANSGISPLGGSNIISVVYLYNCAMTDSTPIALPTSAQRSNVTVYSQKDQQVADAHVITMDGGTIVSATDQRHTASGISWKFRPTSTTRDAGYAMVLSLAKVACAANSSVAITVYTRRDSTNIAGTLKVLGGQIAGVPSDVTVACAPTINTWVLSSTLTVTPTEAGVIEVTFECYDGVGTSNSFWVDDISVT